MASRPEWQPNYRDLSDDRTISFGAECYVCHAHYVSIPEPMVAPLPVEGAPDPALARAIEDQKYALFAEFDSAFRSITIVCFRCGNPACPDCWDVDKQMCGACVAERGLIRSPHRGEPADGPLANGLLRRAEPGQYSEIARPPWLKQLLRAQSDPEAAQLAHLTAPPPVTVTPSRPSAMPTPNLDSFTYPRVPSIEHDRPAFEPPPTAKMDASLARPVPGPTTPDTLDGREGAATSGMVECPRCRTANYDFVTQCSGCGLQLIQICPNCERLNPGHVEQCQQCGSRLTRPAGWSGVHQPIQPLETAEGRRRATAGPAPVTPAWQPNRKPTPEAWRDAERDERLRGSYGGREREPARSGRPWRSPSPPPASSVGGPPMPAMLEVATVHPDVARGLAATHHPYETMGPALQPVMPYDLADEQATRGAHLLQAVASVVERLFTVGLVLCLFAVIGVITAAEASPSANAALSAYLHYDVKAHIDALLGLLHIYLPK
jgi:hypothetical protein